MVALQILTGGLAGVRQEAKIFPFTVGRATSNALVLNDQGVFDSHFDLTFSDEGFVLSVRPHAVVTVNGKPSEGAVLRNGDIIGAGLAKVQFWLGALPQRGLKFREVSTWTLIFGVAISQVYLLARLLTMAR